MLLTALLLGATAVAVGSAIAYYWEDIVTWLKRGIQKVSQMVGRAVHGFQFYLEKRKGQLHEKSINYLKEDNRWHEYTVTREISESEVPAEILQKVRNNNSVDLTQQLAMELS
jgi:hypothetical protein